jgi:CRP-like cAMP-binding protein
MPGEENQQVAEKLDALIRLVALQLVADKGTVEGIRLLGRAGLDRNLIAQVVGTTPGTVSVRLAEAKKSSARKSRPTR